MAKKSQDTKTSQVALKDQPTLHPNYREITVEMTDGETYKTRSTYSKDVLKLAVDKKTHSAWRKGSGTHVNRSADNVKKFSKKFEGLSFLSKPKS